MIKAIQQVGFILEELNHYLIKSDFFQTKYKNIQQEIVDLENNSLISGYTELMGLDNKNFAVNAVIYILQNMFECIEDISKNDERNRLVLNYKKSERSRVAQYNKINASAKYVRAIDQKAAERLKLQAKLFKPFISTPDQSIRLNDLLARAHRHLSTPAFEQVYRFMLSLFAPEELDKLEVYKPIYEAAYDLKKEMGHYGITENQLKTAGSIKIFLLLYEVLEIAKSPLAMWVDDLFKELDLKKRVNIKKDAFLRARPIGRYQTFYIYGYNNSENKEAITRFNSNAGEIDILVKEMCTFLKEMNLSEEAEIFRQSYKNFYYESRIASLLH